MSNFEIKDSFSSQTILRKYQLGASSNVIKIKRTLIKKEVIDISRGKPIILDPAFELWLKRVYFQSS